jgi:hypothetical protein
MSRQSARSSLNPHAVEQDSAPRGRVWPWIFTADRVAALVALVALHPFAAPGQREARTLGGLCPCRRERRCASRRGEEGHVDRLHRPEPRHHHPRVGSAAVELGRTNPDAWRELRQNPDLVPAAALEAVRLASPVRGFTRIVQRNTEIDGSVLRAGQRVVLLYASANMDETQFERPEVFSLHRKGTNLGWGFGAHACVGMHLSKLEMRAMIPAVSQITVSKPVPLLNNTLQGFTSLQAAFRN